MGGLGLSWAIFIFVSPSVVSELFRYRPLPSTVTMQ